MKIRPLQDRVVVKRVAEETRTSGGLYIPDAAQEKPARGKVTAVGPGSRGDDGKLRPLDLKVGDQVLFGKYAGSEIEIDGIELVILRENEILGVVT
jgi:chaperonin GroES